MQSTIRHIVISAMLLLFLLAPILNAEPTTPANSDLFDPQHLVDVQIEMDADDWTALRSQTRALCLACRKPAPPTPFTYFKANVTVDGKRVESVGVRKKGFVGSLDQKYPSLKIKFDDYVDQDPMDGLRRLTLNNNKQDVTVISQYLAYRLFAKAGLPASRCNFAKVTVNGKYLGIYSNVESVKRPFLKRQFGNSDGKLYEGTLADLFVDRVDDFESKIGSDQNREELAALARALEPEQIDIEELEKHLDVDEFLRYWAMESLTNCWDGYSNNQNNYFIYHDPSDSRFHFIPWGTDATCVPFQFIRSEHKSVFTKAVLPRKLYPADGIADRYRETLVELLDEVWDEPSLLAEVDRLEEFLKNHLHPRQNKFTSSINMTRKFIKNRREQFQSELDKWPLEVKGRPLQPTYTNSVGTVKGLFTADWLDEKPESAYEIGDAKLAMVLDDEPVELTKLGVYGQAERNKGEKTRTIMFVGKRKSNRMKVTLRLGMSEDRFDTATSERPIVVQGNLEEGGFGLFGILSTQGVRLVGGTMTVTKTDDKQVTGTIDVDVLRFVEDKREKQKDAGKTR